MARKHHTYVHIRTHIYAPAVGVVMYISSQAALAEMAYPPPEVLSKLVNLFRQSCSLMGGRINCA